MSHAQRQLVTRAVRLEINMQVGGTFGSVRGWLCDDELHSFAGVPSTQWMDNDTCQWHRRGALHRAHGLPAEQWPLQNGKMFRKYYLHGRQVTQVESAAYEDEDEA